METPRPNAFITPEKLHFEFNQATEALTRLRDTLTGFYAERGIKVYDVAQLSASDLIKQARVTILTCFPPNSVKAEK